MDEIQSGLTERELAQLEGSKLFNADLAPVPAAGRKWRLGSFAALWISMSACIPTYMLASGLIAGESLMGVTLKLWEGGPVILKGIWHSLFG